MRLLTNHKKEVFSKSNEVGENKDCSVKAVAIATGVSYSTAHKVCEANGREPQQGMRQYQEYKTFNQK